MQVADITYAILDADDCHVAIRDADGHRDRTLPNKERRLMEPPFFNLLSLNYEH